MILNNRMCIATRKSYPKNELLRFALTTPVVIDENQTIQSRGAYIKNDKEVFIQVLEKGKLHCKMDRDKKEQVIRLIEDLLNG